MAIRIEIVMMEMMVRTKIVIEIERDLERSEESHRPTVVNDTDVSTVANILPQL